MALGGPTSAGSAQPPAPCASARADLDWLESATEAWSLVARRHLRIASGRPPLLVAYDATCRIEGPIGESGPNWSTGAHGGKILLPSGGELPVGVASFAAPFDNDRQAFMLMGLPSVWQAGGVTSELGLETLMTSVFVHEMTHTRQFYAFAPRMAQLTERYGLPDDINDDSLQDRFKGDPAYVAAWTRERDLLLAAVNEPDDAKARPLVREALALARARQARWFTGKDAQWLELEDAFLTLEGMGQWAAWAWLTDPEGGKLTPDRALPHVRRGGRFWSQDQGLLLMLAVDRFVPGWQAQAFAPEPATAFRLWEQAAG